MLRVKTVLRLELGGRDHQAAAVNDCDAAKK